MKTETPRQVAEKIVNQIAMGAWTFQSRGTVIEWIEAALNAERERCAKIAETHERTHGNMHFGYCGPAIAAAIRSTDEN